MAHPGETGPGNGRSSASAGARSDASSAEILGAPANPGVSARPGAPANLDAVERAGAASAQSLPEQFRSLRRRQDAHSLFLMTTGLFFSCTLVIDIALHRPGVDPAVHWLLLAFCLTMSGIVVLVGRGFPVTVGLMCVTVFTVASIYFLSPLGDTQSAVSSAQELPILSLYLGWFVPRPLGRIVMLLSLALLVLVMAFNPLFWRLGDLGVPAAMQTIVVAVFCFEVGSMLWRQSERRSSTDELTGALNRAGFLQRLDRELARAARSGTPMCLVVIDFDHFKQLNDTHGHAAGDRALVETVAGWRSAVRSGDVIGRTGGDEFALVLDGVDAYAAQQILERLRAESTHPWSWGIAQARSDDDRESVFGRADSLLYEAKSRREAP